MIVIPDPFDSSDDAAREGLASEIRRRLGNVPEPRNAPPVSIVVVNRDGVEHLRRLLAGLAGRTDYLDFDLVVVDNGSSDESLEVARSAATPFPISILANRHNESFSDANNQGAELASGELLLFLNNDVVPFERSWLRELVACRNATEAGIAGATLLFPKAGSTWGYLVQHRAMHLLDDPCLPPADLNGHGDDPFAEGFGEDADSVLPTGACMLIERRLFWDIGGFSHGYVYGGEDLDLGLKTLEKGLRVVCSGRSILIHNHGTTRRRDGAEEMRANRLRNARLLWERWGPRLRREYDLDRLAGGGVWAAPGQGPRGDAPLEEEVLALGFCLKSSEPAVERGDRLEALREELVRRGHRYAVLREEAVDDPEAFNYDVVVHLHGPARYVLNPAQLNVLWLSEHSGAAPPPGECALYDLIATADAETASPLRGADASLPIAMLGDEDPAGGLIEAALVRARQLDLPTRISPVASSVP